jgi:two-component system, cell cycle sensor histidine kinase and response regulator CckA
MIMAPRLRFIFLFQKEKKRGFGMEKTKILIVEDNPIVALDLKTKLINLGYDITSTAYSGEDAIESLKHQRPDIALMDIRLGDGINGIETASKLKEEYQVSVIYLTAHADDDTISKAKLTEPYGYIVKPFDDTELKSMIEIAVYKQKSDRKLRESQQWLQTTLNSIGDGVIATDMDGCVSFINPVAETLTGWVHSDAIGRPLDEVFNIINEETRKTCENPVLKVIETGQIVGLANHTLLVSRDGTERPIKDSGAPILLDGRDPLGVILVFQDDSKARKAEAALRQSQKLEAIGNLAGGIAHDFNNILTSIMGFTELSLQDLQHETELHDNLIEVLAAGKRAKSLVKQILTFSRKDEQEKYNIQINSILTENMKMLRSTIPSNITINKQISSESITIKANASQMNQVIINLITNAVQAIEDNGMIDIGLELIQLDKRNMDQYPDMMPGSYAKIYVSDTGCGISKENLNVIFDPYFTTKTPDKGTGLGLAVVHGIVKIHDGHITVYSEPGNGTTFHVYLPTATQFFKKPAIQTETDIPRGGERILFVDDEPSITKLQKRFLERLGYAVTAKTSSLDALETFRRTPDLFQLVITDMTMPEMTGDKLSKSVKEIKLDIPVILCTGFSEKINRKTALDFPVDGFLMKPIDIKKMAETIRNVLDKK